MNEVKHACAWCGKPFRTEAEEKLAPIGLDGESKMHRACLDQYHKDVEEVSAQPVRRTRPRLPIWLIQLATVVMVAACVISCRKFGLSDFWVRFSCAVTMFAGFVIGYWAED